MAAGPRRTKTAPGAADPVVETAVEAAAPAAEAPVETAVETVAPAVETVTAAVETAAAPVEKAAEAIVAATEKLASPELAPSFTAATKSLQAFSTKALEAYKANAAASVEYVQALASVRSVSEAIALQSEHLRKQYETFSAQAKELTALAQQVAADAAGPLKEQFDKAFKAH